MIIYAIIGIIWLIVLEGIIQKEENQMQAFFMRLGNFLLWPITFIIFTYYFIKEIKNQ